MNAGDGDAERSCRVARIAAALGTIGLALDTLIVHSTSISVSVQVVAIGACGVVWIATLVRRRSPTVAFGTAAFLVLNTAIIVAISATTQQIVEAGINYVPFRQHQLGAVAVALLAPPRLWVGVVAILGFVGAAVVQFALFEPAVRASVPYGDPWATIAFGGFALALLVYRLRADRAARAVARAQAEVESYQLYARAVLAIRDLSNSPLQTLINTIAILRARGPELDTIADRLERTAARLTELEEATRPFEEILDLEDGDASWDPKSILRSSAMHPADRRRN